MNHLTQYTLILALLLGAASAQAQRQGSDHVPALAGR